jgi:hypothetical protein
MRLTLTHATFGCRPHIPGLASNSMVASNGVGIRGLGCQALPTLALRCELVFEGHTG